MKLWLLLLSTSAWVDQPPEPIGQLNVEPFRLVSETPEDVGRVPGGVAVVREIRFRNTSEYTLRPAIGWVSCGCLDARAAPATVAPGAEFTIRLSGTAVPAGPDQDLTARYVVSWSVDGKERSIDGDVAVRYSPATDLIVRPSAVAAWRVAGEPLRVQIWVREATRHAMAPGVLRPVISSAPGGVLRTSGLLDATVPEGPSTVQGDLEFSDTPEGIADGWLAVGSTPEAVALRVPVRVRTVLAWRASPGAAHLRAPAGATARAAVQLRPVGSASRLPECTIDFEPPVDGLSADIDGNTLRFLATQVCGADGTTAVVRDKAGVLVARIPVVLWPKAPGP